MKNILKYIKESNENFSCNEKKLIFIKLHILLNFIFLSELNISFL